MVKQEIFIVNVGNDFREREIVPLLKKFDPIIIRNFKQIFKIFPLSKTKKIILIESFGKHALLGMILQYFLRARFVVRVRGDVITELDDKMRDCKSFICFLRIKIDSYLIKKSFKASDLIIYNSKHIEKKLQPFINSSLTEEAVIHNPFVKLKQDKKFDTLAIPTGKLNLLTVTNMDYEGKVGPTIEAVKKWLSESFLKEQDIHWLILGTGKYFDKFSRLIRNQGVENRIHLLGWVDDVAPYYEWCDIYVHLTRLDAFPNATMEAMSQARPVITNSDSCGVREQVYDGENGFVISGQEEFLKALKEYNSNSILRNKHGDRGADLVEQWDIPHMRKQMESLIKNS